MHCRWRQLSLCAFYCRLHASGVRRQYNRCIVFTVTRAPLSHFCYVLQLRCGGRIKEQSSMQCTEQVYTGCLKVAIANMAHVTFPSGTLRLSGTMSNFVVIYNVHTYARCRAYRTFWTINFTYIEHTMLISWTLAHSVIRTVWSSPEDELLSYVYQCHCYCSVV